MKNKRVRSLSSTLVGAISFFVLVTVLMQIAILVYDYIRQRTDNNLLIAVLILIVIVILSVICTLADYLRRKIMVERPLKRILSATEKISEGDFSVRLPIEHEYGKYNEYDLISENLNRMAAELSKNEVLRMDFISNVSHEIKTPLAVIQNYATLLLNEGSDGAARKRYTKTLTQAARRITDLITNILRLNKLENQEIQEKKEFFNLTEALSETVLSFESVIEQKNISLSCDFDELSVVSAQSLLEIVTGNLISNALKFTDDGGEVSITLKSNKSDAVIIVSDTGCGIPPEVGARIFEKFYQCDTSHSQEGNGLGLALVKKVVDLIGGEISVTSEVGKGSTFTVVLKDVVR